MTERNRAPLRPGLIPRRRAVGAWQGLKWTLPALALLLAAACGGGAPPEDSDSAAPGAGGTGSSAGGSLLPGGGIHPGGGPPGVGGTGTKPPEQINVEGLELEGSPEYFRVVRMTHSQWEASVRDLLRLSAAPGLSDSFFPDALNGFLFNNNERGLFMTDTLRLDYERAAQTVAAKVVKDQAVMTALGHAGDASGFIADIGRRAHRRALTEAESAAYLALWQQGAEFFASGDAFKDGVQIFLEALLQSTHFIHRIELSDSGSRLSGTELATKLSLLLRNTTPSDELLALAESGGLDTNEGLVALATEMLAEDVVTTDMDAFFAQLYGLEGTLRALQDATRFPTFTEETAATLHDADVMFFEHIFKEGLGLRDIFTSKTAFVNTSTASIYGLTMTGESLRQVELDDTRPGFLTRAGFLAKNGTLTNPDPIHRGVDINKRMLCAKLEPPPGVEIPAVPTPKPGQTNREAVTTLTEEGICAECHTAIINPPGFALEGFDTIGKVRTMDGGKPVDTTGTFGSIPSNPAFAGATEMVNILADSGTAHACFAARLAEFSLTRDLGQGEAELIQSLTNQSHNSNASVKDLLLALVQSPAFTNQKTGTP
jgi:hypothetical protein